MIRSALPTAQASWALKQGSIAGLVRVAFAAEACLPTSHNPAKGYEQIDSHPPGFPHS